MFKNDIKIAWRSLFKNRSSSIINIGGLAVGMAEPRKKSEIAIIATIKTRDHDQKLSPRNPTQYRQEQDL
jgi:hypothetical protein